MVNLPPIPLQIASASCYKKRESLTGETTEPMGRAGCYGHVETEQSDHVRSTQSPSPPCLHK